MTNYVTTSEAAEIIGCVDSRVRQLLRAGKVAGRRVGRDWLVDRASAERWRDSDRKPGRVPKAKPEKAPKGKRGAK
jgi:excisionase family DNA binding protein